MLLGHFSADAAYFIGKIILYRIENGFQIF